MDPGSNVACKTPCPHFCDHADPEKNPCCKESSRHDQNNCLRGSGGSSGGGSSGADDVRYCNLELNNFTSGGENELGDQKIDHYKCEDGKKICGILKIDCKGNLSQMCKDPNKPFASVSQCEKEIQNGGQDGLGR